MHQPRANAPVIGYLRGGRPIYLVAGASPDAVPLPDDLTAIPDAELSDLIGQHTAEFLALADGESVTSADVLRGTALAAAIETLEAEQTRRDGVNAAALADQRGRVDAAHARSQARMTVDPEPAAPADPEPAAPADPAPAEPAAPAEPSEAVVAAVAAGVVRALIAGGAITAPRTREEAALRRPSLNAHLGQIAEIAPDPKVVPPRREAVIVSSGDIKGYPAGSTINGRLDLVSAMGERARSAKVTHGSPEYLPVAHVERRHRYLLDEKATPEQINEVLVAATNPETLIASGGWQALEEISYDFFNVVCEDGLADWPTVGIARAGLKWPVSPSFGDIMGLDDNPWTWTDADDRAARDSNSVLKPCQQIPNQDFDDETLACDGICLTAGNLTSFAFPELVANHTTLLMAAHAHYMNLRKINTVIAGSTAVAFDSTLPGFIAPLLSAMDLEAIHEREKFRMCEDAVIESLLPRWVIGATRADLSLRQGADYGWDQTVAWLIQRLDARRIRTQMVTDYQIGGAGQIGGATAPVRWSTSVNFLMFAPATWLQGQGMRLDLGIVRDSVLNETNDHTAAWMEDCYLMAKVGHESLNVNVPVCVNGNTNAGGTDSCGGIS